MKTRILKKINKQIRIVEDETGYFQVQRREYLGLFKGEGEWTLMNQYSTFQRAIAKKNMHIVLVIMRDLGYRHELAQRRRKRKRAKGLI